MKFIKLLFLKTILTHINRIVTNIVRSRLMNASVPEFIITGILVSMAVWKGV